MFKTNIRYYIDILRILFLMLHKSRFNLCNFSLKKHSNSKIKRTLQFKNNKNILFLEITILLFFSAYFFSVSQGMEEEFVGDPTGMFNSAYSVENLRGDTQGLFKYWSLEDGNALTVNIINPASISSDKIDIIKYVLLSTEKIHVEDSLLGRGATGSFSDYYEGWKGALQAAALKETKYEIPTDFQIVNSKTSDGDIVIILSNVKDSSGNTGYTKSVLEGNKIIKSFITIYDIRSLSNNQLETIARHEIGHAIGLAHSTAKEDLMAPVIDMTFPYISECNVESVIDLYNGNSDGSTTCKK